MEDWKISDEREYYYYASCANHHVAHADAVRAETKFLATFGQHMLKIAKEHTC